MTSMPYLRGKVQIYDVWDGGETDGWTHSYRENGRQLILIFDGFNENPPLCTVEHDTTTPIMGNNVVFSSEVVRPYG